MLNSNAIYLLTIHHFNFGIENHYNKSNQTHNQWTYKYDEMSYNHLDL